ncbi:MAG: PAS domain-containing protein [Acidobacteria bacterium]|nr:PAS domain-containing protein [Acidobacteriota bacterium]
MRLGIKGKQVLGVTTIVGAVVVVVSLMHLAQLAKASLDGSGARAELLASAISSRVSSVPIVSDPYEAMHGDAALRSLLEASLNDPTVTVAAIANLDGVAVLNADLSQEGHPVPVAANLRELLARPALSQLLAIYRDQGRNLDFAQPLFMGDQQIGSIHIGVSSLLIRRDLNRSLGPAVLTALGALGIAVFGATVLAQLLLRPIHVIRSGLTRLGRGETGVQLDLPQADEFGELGTFFNTVSAQIAADRSHMAGQVAHLESAVEHLEDAVAIVGPDGRLLFANPAMRSLIPSAVVGASLEQLAPADHPLRRMAEDTLTTRQSRGPTSATFNDPKGETGERLLLAHPVNDAAGQLVGVMLIARNVEYLSQVESTIRYSRKLAALGRLSAGVAHEVKNPLNAMAIHLELLRQYVAPSALASARGGARGPLGIDTPAPSAPPPEALQHVDVIAREIRRLDEVVQGFLKFSRPEDLKLQPVNVAELINEVVPIVTPEAEQRRVSIAVEAEGAPEVNGDPGMLRQAILNLALNACQAMPDGGTLRLRCESIRGRRVRITVADTGIGIKPEHLKRIFDLYFTTKEKGSGIGLSMVYRTVQMHDGEIEVQSTPGKGTTFTIVLPQA